MRDNEPILEAGTTVILTHEQWEEFRASNRSLRRRAWAMVALAVIAMSALAIGQLAQQGRDHDRDLRDQRLAELAQDNHDALQILQRVTSPDAAAAQQHTLDEAIIRIDCNNRKAVEDAINQLAAQKLIRPIHVTKTCQ